MKMQKKYLTSSLALFGFCSYRYNDPKQEERYHLFLVTFMNSLMFFYTLSRMFFMYKSMILFLAKISLSFKVFSAGAIK